MTERPQDTTETQAIASQPKAHASGADSPLAEHLIRLPGEHWALWRWSGLRGAGFPAANVLDLADDVCAARADQLIDAEERVEQAYTAALVVVNRALDALRAADSWDNSELRMPLIEARQTLKRGQLPEPQAVPASIAAEIATLRAAREQLDRHRAAFDSAFAATVDGITQTLADVTASEQFREALLWQNRHALHTVVATLQSAARSATRSSKMRQHEELIANYLQRYCVKNDTIGFFGPVGWARLASDGAIASVRPGPQLLRSRMVSFEQWAIDALVESLGNNTWLRPWLAPRRLPSIDLSGTTLYRPSKSPAKLSAAQAAALEACNGERAARTIAADLRRLYPLQVKSDAEVYRLLDQLSTLGLIVWKLEIPFASRPEHALRRLLERIGEERLRQPALAALDELDTLRDAVAQAAGSADDVDRALDALASAFTRLTGEAATRGAGATYAARTLVYEDTQRDIDVTFGPALLAELGPPLSLLLTSARWFTYQAAQIYRAAFDQIYADLAPHAGSGTVEMASFWQQVQIRLLGDHAPQVVTVMRLFQERWAAILALPDDQRQVDYTSAALQSAVAAAFDAPGPGWQSARYHSPDVMIAAASPEAIQRDEYHFVMGELHLASNTLRGSFFIEQHPSPAELFAAVERDLPEPRIVPITPRTWKEITSRTRPDLIAARDVRLAFTNDACAPPEARVLPIGALVVAKTERGLEVRTRDGRQRFDIVEFFADIVSLEIVDGFKILSPGLHTPRVTIDRLVVARETWRFDPGALPFARIKAEAERFLAARRWARQHDLPRQVFVKASIERKPFYVDFDSPILVNILAKAVRRTMEQGGPTASITITEMLPTLSQLWLPDAEGRRYTSELRIVAVDQADDQAYSDGRRL
ncbi:MAG TPA: lantibiotic dehydratase [Herpetosiphonaceae bacterium]